MITTPSERLALSIFETKKQTKQTYNLKNKSVLNIECSFEAVSELKVTKIREKARLEEVNDKTNIRNTLK